MAGKGEQLRDLMTADPIVLDASATVAEAAKCMRDRDVGDVLVRRNGRLAGILTDRDLVVRCLASEENDPRRQPVGELCSQDLLTLPPDADVEEAMQLMQENAVRRIPIVEGDRAVGIVSLGDLAIARDRRSCLGEISAAPPNS
ncbi:MAG TPA: CBS domain-containing protein [Myxococcota bacterium]|jgi:CBS domain-containing protein